MTRPEPDLTAEEIDRQPPATAADWLEAGPEDRHPYGFEPRAPEPATERILDAWWPGPEPEAGL